MFIAINNKTKQVLTKSNGWVDDLQKARTFTGKGHATNAARQNPERVYNPVARMSCTPFNKEDYDSVEVFITLADPK